MLLSKKLRILGRWRQRSYSASTASALPHDEFGLLGCKKEENSSDARLLSVRIISSTENLYQTIPRFVQPSSSTDEGFVSCSQTNSSDDLHQHREDSDDTQVESSESGQGTMHTVIRESHDHFTQLDFTAANYLSAVRAVVTGDVLQLLHLINVLKVPVDASNLQGMTLLHWAAKNDRVTVARLLLSLGADIERSTIKGRSVLHIAVRNNAARCLKLLLKQFCELEKDIANEFSRAPPYGFLLLRDSNEDSLLHLACRLRKRRCLKILLSCIMKYAGWQIAEEMLQERNKCNQTPVHVACLWKSVESVDLLLTDSLDKVVGKIYGSKERSDIAIALRAASRRTLFWRIERGTVLHEMATVKCSCAGFPNDNCSSSVKNDRGLEIIELQTYLLGGCTAVESFGKRCTYCDEGQLEVVRKLLRSCPELVVLRDVLGQTALMCSAINDAVPLTKVLLECKGAEELKCMDSNSHTALHHAAARGKLRQVELLLEKGASSRDQDDYGATPMHYAAVRGFYTTLQLLYKTSNYDDAARTYNGHSAFMWAVMNGVGMSIQAMIEANPSISREDCDKQGCTALHLAAARDHVRIINNLLFLNWDVEKQNNLGETPLMIAAKNGCANSVRVLLESGVDYFTRDKSNNTALHLAANSDGKIEAVRELLRFFCDTPLLNARNDKGQTPLHCAAENNAVQCIRYLFKNGTDPLIRDNRGWDPLMVAIRQGCWSTITVILKNSPNINCYSAFDNQTTLSLALKKKNYILASFLKTNGAMLACEIQDIAARVIQRWYRKHLVVHQIVAMCELDISYSP